LARRRRASCGETALGAAREHGPVRDVGQTSDRQRSRPHRAGNIAARPRLRCDAGAAAMAMDIDRNGVAQHGEGRRCVLGGLARLRGTARPAATGEHRPDRDKRCAPHRGLGWRDVAMTATIHGILPTIATALAYVAVIVCPARSPEAPSPAATRGSAFQQRMGVLYIDIIAEPFIAHIQSAESRWFGYASRSP